MGQRKDLKEELAMLNNENIEKNKKIEDMDSENNIEKNKDIEIKEIEGKKIENEKTGFVTLIGRPNVGKSTLMNKMIGQKIAITSSKPQTTRNRIQTVYTCERGQIVFLDTPGMLQARNKLQEYMSDAAEGTLGQVDVILWLVEASDYIGAGDR